MVDNGIHIQRAGASDAALIAHLSAVTFFDTFDGTCTDDDMEGFIQQNFNIPQIETELRNEDDFYFVACLNDIPIGYMRLKEEDTDIEIIRTHGAIELKRLYVLKEYHSKKIGAALMNFALNFAAEKDYEIIWLGVWEYNEKAKSFYRKFGFEDTGVEHPFPIGNTPQTDRWLYRFVKQ